MAMTRDGLLYEIGRISLDALYQDEAYAKSMIEKIKFNGARYARDRVQPRKGGEVKDPDLVAFRASLEGKD